MKLFNCCIYEYFFCKLALYVTYMYKCVCDDVKLYKYYILLYILLLDASIKQRDKPITMEQINITFYFMASSHIKHFQFYDIRAREYTRIEIINLIMKSAANKIRIACSKKIKFNISENKHLGGTFRTFKLKGLKQLIRIFLKYPKYLF